MLYKQVEQYLQTHFANFGKHGAKALQPSLHNIEALCKALNNPHKVLKTIHIAGTNGKGSVAYMLASILQASGYKVGLFVSPYYKNFREQIKINGKDIDKQFVRLFVKKQTALLDVIKPSFFEIMTAMAFHFFAQKKVDIAIIETGLGGTWDSTNIINPLLSIITNIGYEHQNILGHSLAEIAQHKAGIIKPNTPVLIGEKHPETEPIFGATAKNLNAPIFWAEESVNTALIKTLNNCLSNTYQQKNIQIVLMAIKLLKKNNAFKIYSLNVKQGLKNIVSLTNFKGRWQTISKTPRIIADSAHNAHGINQVIVQIKSINFEKLHIVLGLLSDKNLEQILPLLPTTAQYYFCSPPTLRALPALFLQQQALLYNLKGNMYTTVKKALNDARKNAHPQHDLIIVCGSTFIIAQVI